MRQAMTVFDPFARSRDAGAQETGRSYLDAAAGTMAQRSMTAQHRSTQHDAMRGAQLSARSWRPGQHMRQELPTPLWICVSTCQSVLDWTITAAAIPSPEQFCFRSRGAILYSKRMSAAVV
jgi:hypothetical protein